MRKAIIVAVALIFALSSTAAAQISEIVIDFPSAGIFGLPDVPNLESGVVEIMPGDNVTLRITLPTNGENDIPCKC
jgi:hypothetical protein